MIAYIGIGSNLGQREGQVEAAIGRLAELGSILHASSLYESPAWGKTDQPAFINAVAALDTTLEAEALLDALQNIEQVMGRERFEKWGPRKIDLDLLSLEDQQLQTNRLTLPHPHIAERLFVLVPWMEIAPSYVLAGHTETIAEQARTLMQQTAPAEWPEMLAYQIP